MMCAAEMILAHGKGGNRSSSLIDFHGARSLGSVSRSRVRDGWLVQIVRSCHHLCAGLARPQRSFGSLRAREVVSRSPRQGITVAIREAKTRHASVTADGVDDERDAVGDLKDGVLRAHVGPHPARSNRQQRARIVRMPG